MITINSFSLKRISPLRHEDLRNSWVHEVQKGNDMTHAFKVKGSSNENPRFVVGSSMLVDDLGPLAGILGASFLAVKFGYDKEAKDGEAPFRVLLNTTSKATEITSPFFEATMAITATKEFLMTKGKTFRLPIAPLDSVGTSTGLIPRQISDFVIRGWMFIALGQMRESLPAETFTVFNGQILQGFTFNLREVRNSLLLPKQKSIKHINWFYSIKNLLPANNFDGGTVEELPMPGPSSFDLLLLCDSCNSPEDIIKEDYEKAAKIRDEMNNRN